MGRAPCTPLLPALAPDSIPVSTRKDFVASSVLFGGSIHFALEILFRARLKGLGITHEALLLAYHDAWQRQLRDGGDVPVPTDADRVTAMKESVAGVWDVIQAGNFYPNPSPQNCTPCPYRSRCPVFGGK